MILNDRTLNLTGVAGAVAYTATTVTTTTTTPATTSIALVSSSASPASGASVTLTATVNPPSVPATVVSFYDGSTLLGTGTTASGVATLTTSSLSSGAHALTAVFPSSSAYAASTSATVTVTVGSGTVTPTATSTALASSSATPANGASVTLTATITPSSVPPSVVSFYNGGTLLGTGTTSSGVATFSTSSLATGAHSLTAVFPSSSSYASSTSPTVTVTVAAPAVTPATVFGANLVLWDRADLGATVSSGTVTALVDQAAAPITYNATGTVSVAANAQHSLPGFNVASAGNGLVGTAHATKLDFEYNQPFSVACAFVAGTSTSFDQLIGQSTGSGNFRGWAFDCSQGISSGKAGLRLTNTLSSGGGTETFAYSPTTLVSGQAYSYVMTYDGSGLAAGITIYLNGVVQTPGVVQSPNNPLAATIVDAASLPFVIKSNASLTSGHTFLDGYVVNRVITASEVTNIETNYTNAHFAIH